jgi:benzoate/toluate 1,2-dioxygenase alpha subunit
MAIEAEAGTPAAYAAMVRESPTDFRVRTEIYTDPRIFEDEMRSIFQRTWVYAAHESEVAHPGDYVTTYVGAQPLIVSRDQDGALHVLLNACRHRGNSVCREERGNSMFFRCPYHGWTYKNDGQLIGISHRTGYPADFGQAIPGLVPAGRVGVYRGLIFVDLSGEAGELEEHLAGVKQYVDYWADLSPVGTCRLLRPHKFVYPGNWKFQMENGSDGYHPRFVHESAFATMAHSRGVPMRDSSGMNEVGALHSFALGHGVLERPGMAALDPSVYSDYTALLRASYGPERPQRILAGYNILLFPNVYLMEGNVRVITPVSVDETVIYSYPTWLDGVPDHVNKDRLRDVQWRLGTTGMIGTDDMEMFAANQSGMHAEKMEWIVLSRGIDREAAEPGGGSRGEISDENPQRAMYREWARLMSREPRS